MSLFTIIFYALPLAIGFLSLLVVYLFVLLPKRRLAFYAKQGIKTRYLPVIGAKNMRKQIMEQRGDCMATDKEASRTEPELKVTAINLGKDVLLGLRDTEYIKEFLHNPAGFKKAKYFGIFKPLLGSGLLFVEGDQWKTRRKLISSSFHYEFITSNTQLIQETAREFLDKIPPAETKNCLIMNKLQEITGEVVGRIFFGRNLNRYSFEGQPLTLALAALMADLGDFVRTPLYMLLNVKTLLLPIPQRIRLTRRIKEFRAQCERIIQDRKNENQRYHDLLDALLEQQRQEPVGSDKRLSDEDIINEFITFFMAGMDTTGHLVTMMLYHLTQHPQYLVKLAEERKVHYDTSKEASVEAIQSMNILTCFIKETLRHHTPAPTVFPREAAKDVQLKDILIKKGTIVKTDPLVLFHNSEYFQEPEKFKPERWENPNTKMDPYAFIPFSAGPRNCIGQHLATLEAKIIISEFLERFDFKISEGYNLKMIFRFLYEPYEDMRMDLSRK